MFEVAEGPPPLKTVYPDYFLKRISKDERDIVTGVTSHFEIALN